MRPSDTVAWATAHSSRRPASTCVQLSDGLSQHKRGDFSEPPCERTDKGAVGVLHLDEFEVGESETTQHLSCRPGTTDRTTPSQVAELSVHVKPLSSFEELAPSPL